MNTRQKQIGEDFWFKTINFISPRSLISRKEAAVLTIHWKEIKRKREWVLQKAETGEKRKAFHRHFVKCSSTFVRILYSHLNAAVAFGLIQDQGTPTNTSNYLYV